MLGFNEVILFCYYAAEVEKNSKKIEEAKKFDIQIISEDFVEEAKAGGAVILINKKSICSWGSDVSVFVIYYTINRKQSCI